MHRTPSHFETLASLLRMEQSEERARHAEEKTQLTLGEREARGLTLLDLEVVEDAVGLGGRLLLTLARPDRRPWNTPLHPGDLVELRPRRAEVSEPARGIVSRSSRGRVQLAFDRPPPDFVSEGRLLLDLVPNDVTFERAQAALRQLLSMDRGAEGRKREVLLGGRAPEFDRAEPAAPGVPLNPEQVDAVGRALGARDLFLVHGPPGTGKSTVLTEVAVQAVQRGERVLATAASNAAVDHLLELCLARGLRALRVGHPARVAEHLQAHTLDIQVEDHPDRQLSRSLFDEAFGLFGYARRQRTQGRSRERFSNARESTAEAKQLLTEARTLERKAVSAVLGRADVLCATLASLPAGPLASERFELALVDEATQALEPLTLMAFLQAERVVLAGDPQQLPPTVLSQDAARRGLAVSLFERLLSDHGEGVKGMLREQHRMSEALMAFPSREMYGGELRAHPAVRARTLDEVLPPGHGLDAPSLLFLDTAGKGFEEEAEAVGGSLFNPGEAGLVVAHAQELLRAGLAAGELAVIAPYRAQAARVRELLAAQEVEVDTVDAFQGREKDAVLLTLTRSNSEGTLGFLTDLRRINVALTRARRHLFLVGDSATLGHHPFYLRLLEEVQRQGGYRSAWEWPQAGA